MSAELEAVVTGDEIIECQQTVRLVPLPDHVKQFVLDLVRAARTNDPDVAPWVRELIDWDQVHVPASNWCWVLRLVHCYRASSRHA